MSSGTFQFKVDVANAQAAADGLAKAFKRVDIGGELTKQIKEQQKVVQQMLQSLSQEQIDLAVASPDEAKAYFDNVKQIEVAQQRINELMLQQRDNYLQKNNLSKQELTQITNNAARYQQNVNSAQRLVQEQQKILQQRNEETRLTQQQAQTTGKTLNQLRQRLETERLTHALQAQITTAIKAHQEATANVNQQVQQRVKEEERLTKLIQDRDKAQEQHGLHTQVLDSVKEQVDANQQLETQVENVGQAYKQNTQTARDGLKASTQEAKRKNEQLDGVSKTVTHLTEKMKRLAEFTIAAFALRQLRQFAQEGLRFVQELDQSLTEIATVTGRTRDEMWGMAEEFNRMGRELGKTTNEITRASVLFYRQGLETNQVLEMVRASTISAAIANTNAEEASNRLTAALRGYNLAATEAMTISDKLAALAAQSASSFDELSYAMTKTAASAAVAGIDLDHLYAYLAKVIETTREAPENIGTAFKTIIARIAQIKEAGEVVEDGVVTPLNKVHEALESVGVALVDSQGQIRDMQYIFNELGEIWDELDRNTKSYLATIIAGSRQQSRFLALMNNFQRTSQLVAVSQNSAGEASRQFQTHLTGLEASMVRLTAAKEDFMMRLIDHNAYKGVIDAMRTLLDIFSGMHPALTLLIGAITLYIFKLMASQAALMAKNAAQIASNAESQQSIILTSLNAVKQVFLAATTKAAAAAFMAKAAAVAVATGGLSLLTAALIGAVVGLANLTSATKRNIEAMQEEVGQYQEKATVLERQLDQLDNLIAEQERLQNQITRTAQEEARLNEINQELILSFGHLDYTVDHLGNVSFNNLESHVSDVRKEINQLRLDALLAERTLSNLQFQESLDEILSPTLRIKDFLPEEGIDSVMAAGQRSRQQLTEAQIAAINEQMEQFLAQQKIQVDRLKQQYIDDLVIKESEISAVVNDYGNLGLALTQALADGISRGFQEELLQARTEKEIEEVVSNIEDAIQHGLASFDFTIDGRVVSEDDFAEYLRLQNQAISQFIEEGQDLAIVRDYIAEVEQQLVRMGIEGEKALIVFSDPVARDFAMSLQQIQQTFSELQFDDIDRRVEHYTSQGIFFFNQLNEAINQHANELEQLANIEGLTGVERQDFVNENLRNQIDLYDQLLIKMNEIPDLQQRMNELSGLLDDGNVNLYNLAIRELGQELELTNEQSRIFNELLGQFEVPAGYIDIIEAQEVYRDNMSHLLELEKQMIEGRAVTGEQLIDLIHLYGQENVAIEMKNGLLQLTQEGVKNLQDIEDVAHENRMANIRAGIEAQIVKLKAEAYVLEQTMHMEKSRAEIAAEVTDIMNKLSGEEIEAIAHNAEEGSRLFAQFAQDKADLSAQGFLAAAANADSFGGAVAKVFQRLGEIASAYFTGVANESTNIAVPTYGGQVSEAEFRRWQANDHSRTMQAGGDYTRRERESRLNEIRGQIANLRNILANLENFDFSDLRRSLDGITSGSGSAADEQDKLKDAIKNTKEAVKDAAKEVEEYASKLDMWYNATRRILVIERELDRIRKQRSLSFDDDDINASLEQEILLLRQLEQQHRQLYEMQLKERETIAAALEIAAGAAVTLSDDLKHLHVNQAAYQALSAGEKEIVDSLIEQFDALSDAIHQSEMAALDAAIAMQQLQLQAADRFIKSIQDALRKQQRLVIAAIDHEIEQHRKAHEAKMKHYEDELSAIEAIIQAKIDALDQEQAEEEWEEQLQKALDRELELRNQINALALDDSYEAQAQKADLEDELQEHIASIEKMQRDRQRQLRRRELQDLQEHYRRQYEQAKQSADQELQVLIEHLNQAKEAINYHYQEIYNDEEKWSEMRRAILEGDIEAAQEMAKKLEHFFEDIAGGIHEIAGQYGVELTYLHDLFQGGVEDGIKALGISWNATKSIFSELEASQRSVMSITDALTAKIKAMTAEILRHVDAINKAAKSGGSVGGSGGSGGTQPGGGDGSGGGGTKPLPPGDSSNKWYNMGWNAGVKYVTDEYRFKTMQAAEGALVVSIIAMGGEGNVGRSGFRAAVSAAGGDPRKQSSQPAPPPSGGGDSGSGGSDRPWWDLWHDGGLVAATRNQYHSNYSRIPGGSSNNLSQLINRLFQTKDDEIVGKLLKGEVVVNPVANFSNLQDNLKSFVSNLQKGISTEPIVIQGSSANGGDVHVHVKNMVADNKEHVQKVFAAINRGQDRMGKRG